MNMPADPISGVFALLSILYSLLGFMRLITVFEFQFQVFYSRYPQKLKDMQMLTAI